MTNNRGIRTMSKAIVYNGRIIPFNFTCGECGASLTGTEEDAKKHFSECHGVQFGPKKDTEGVDS